MTILQTTATVTSRYLMIAESDETARILSTSATNINATIESEPLIAERSSSQREKKHLLNYCAYEGQRNFFVLLS